MATQRHLKNAPIREAVVDIRIKRRSGFDIASLEPLKKIIEKEYPQADERLAQQAQVTLGPAGISARQAGPPSRHAYLFRSENKLQVFQARLDGFSFNRLKPYPTWADFRAEAFRLWGIYAQAAKPEGITRVGLRYINDIDWPLQSVESGEFVTAQAPIAASSSLPVAEFFGRSRLVDENTNANCLVTVALQEDSQANVWRFLLDIDAFKETPIDNDATAIWRCVDELRNLKNRVFFESITEKAAKRYE